MNVPALFFYLFSAVLIGAAFMVISSRNPVHSVLFLILAFFNAAGLFLLLGAEFLAMILVVVYVGAVAVLFLFVVMMLDVDFAEFKQGVLQYLPIGGTIGAIVLLELILVVSGWTIDASSIANVATPAPPGHEQHSGARARALYAICLSVRGGWADPPHRNDWRHRSDPTPQDRRQAPECGAPECANAG